MDWEKAKIVREVPENTFKLAENIYATWVKVNALKGKINGIGDWGIGVLLGSIIFGSFTYGFVAAYLPEILTIAPPETGLSIGIAIYIFLLTAASYGFAYYLSRKHYSQSLYEARKKLLDLHIKDASEFETARKFLENLKIAGTQNFYKEI